MFIYTTIDKKYSKMKQKKYILNVLQKTSVAVTVVKITL